MGAQFDIAMRAHTECQVGLRGGHLETNICVTRLSL